MKTAIEYIALRLRDYNPVTTIELPDLKTIVGVRYFTDGDPADDRFLYIVTENDVHSRKDLPKNILYCAAVPAGPKTVCNSICLKSDVSLEDVEEKVRDVWFFMERHHKLLGNLIACMTKPDFLQTAADLCYGFWNSPVAIYDTSFKHLASSSQYVPSDSRVSHVTESGFMSMDNINTLRKQGRLQAYYSRDPYKITNISSISSRNRIKGQEYGYIDVPVRAQGKVIGCMALIALDRHPDEMDADCLFEVSSFIAIALQRDGAYMQSIANQFEMLFQDILKGILKDDATIEARLLSLGKQLKSQRRIMVIPLEGVDSEDLYRKSESFQEELRVLIPGAITAYYKEKIVLLLSDDRSVTIGSADSRFRTYMEINHLNAGISRQFTQLSLIRDHYDEAQASLRLGRRYYPEQPFYYYDNFSLTHELEILSQTADLKSFCHPELIRLAESGRKSDKELLLTMYFYLVYSKDWAKVCDLMHIHKSTLFYRVKKLRELGNFDLTAGSDIYMLMHSFHILRYTNLLEP